MLIYIYIYIYYVHICILYICIVHTYICIYIYIYYIHDKYRVCAYRKTHYPDFRSCTVQMVWTIGLKTSKKKMCATYS